MELRYIGPHSAVYIPLPERNITVERGQSAAFPDDLAEQMLEQETNWEPAADDANDAAHAELLSKSRDELNTLAAASGVDTPESLPNKGAVAAAIVAAGAPKENQ